MPLYRRLPLTTRGDLLTHDASNNTRLAIGSTGKVLRSDGTDPSWQALAASDIASGTLAVARGGNGVAAIPFFSVHKNGTNQTGIVTNTFTKVTWGTEVSDTNSNFASDRFTPTIAGTYLFICNVLWNNTTASGVQLLLGLAKNGADINETYIITPAANQYELNALVVMNSANGSTDYYEIYVQHKDSVNRDIFGGSASTFWQGLWIGP
jgi:hypothetical protein